MYIHFDHCLYCTQAHQQYYWSLGGWRRWRVGVYLLNHTDREVNVYQSLLYSKKTGRTCQGHIDRTPLPHPVTSHCLLLALFERKSRAIVGLKKGVFVKEIKSKKKE